MLPVWQQYVFLVFALLTSTWGARGFYRLYRRVRRGRPDSDLRTDRLPMRFWYALSTSLTQSRTFRKRSIVSVFHAFIFYGFVFYILVNMVDAAEGYIRFSISSGTVPGAVYNLLADVLSFLVLIGVVALVVRRFFLPSRRDFRFNATTILHKDVSLGYISLDSLLVSGFILFHVGSRAVGAGARLAQEGPDKFQPFATLLSHLFNPANAQAWRIFGYWGALGSVLLFLAYFPYTKHVHIFMAPAKYFFARRAGSGVIPLVDVNLEVEDLSIGAKRLEDLAWPRLLDAYACIQCNRCQDVCPATVTGKSLSPAALEINKRMELNELAKHQPGFETGAPSSRPLLEFAISSEAAWACTTCGACMQVCPVQDEQMLDILDIRRNQVLMEGEFPTQLQGAFRGMERAGNPWGIGQDKRFDWAEGLNVRTTDENPSPDVLYWVGCAASYDPQAQKTARAFVQLLSLAGINYAVLGKKECCTGDSARRAGNEVLYRELAGQNVATLNTIRPRLIVATCPHCMNAIGNEYSQIGGDYKVMHHTQYLSLLIADGRLSMDRLDASIAYHDPCYLGRHNGVYDAPREVLQALGSELLELERSRENAFCCGAGGAQFWKEEEPGSERVSENRFQEVKQRLSTATQPKTLAVACPFCKSMLGSTPGKSDTDGIAVRDVAELLLESVQKKMGILASARDQSEANTKLPKAREEDPEPRPVEKSLAQEILPEIAGTPANEQAPVAPVDSPARKKWRPPAKPMETIQPAQKAADAHPEPEVVPTVVERKKWTPKQAASQIATPLLDSPASPDPVQNPSVEGQDIPSTTGDPTAPARRKWQPKQRPSE